MFNKSHWEIIMILFYLSLIDTEEEKSKFEKLYYDYRALMKYIAFDIMKDEHLAEDAVHNAFIKLTNYLDKIDDTDCHKTKGFIVIVIRSVAKDMYRKRKRELDFSVDENITYRVSDDFSLTMFDVDEIVSKIETLPEIYKDVLILKCLQEFDNKEIASVLNIKSNTVRKRLERAKILLAELLEKDGEYGDLLKRR